MGQIRTDVCCVITHAPRVIAYSARPLGERIWTPSLRPESFILPHSARKGHCSNSIQLVYGFRRSSSGQRKSLHEPHEPSNGRTFGFRSCYAMPAVSRRLGYSTIEFGAWRLHTSPPAFHIHDGRTSDMRTVRQSESSGLLGRANHWPVR